MPDATRRTTSAAAVAGLVAFWILAAGAARPASQAPSAPAAVDVDADESLRTLAPAVYARLVGQERAQGLFFATLAARSRVPERVVWPRLTDLLLNVTRTSGPVADGGQGLDALGPEAARLIRRAFAFEREVIAIHAVHPAGTRRAALDVAIARYQQGPAVADAAKDMAILYDHPYTSFVPPVPPEAEPRRVLRYPALTGALWAARWYGLAVLTQFEDVPAGAERDRFLAIVDERLRAKLSRGAPPAALPTELPLAPAIAPGLVATHDRAAAIVDNLHMMLDVLADVLVHPAVRNRRAAVQKVVDEFSTRHYRCVQVDEWIVVALRHSIFAQGGPALATMSARERNAFAGVHGQHYGPRRLPPPCDP
jgi:hypothetical protein